MNRSVRISRLSRLLAASAMALTLGVVGASAQDVIVLDLKPGTKLTQTITTTTIPRDVNTVRTLKGKVWQVIAPSSVILTLPDGRNHLYKVPSHTQFTIDGKKKTVFDLKKGMMFEATIITDGPRQSPPPTGPRSDKHPPLSPRT